MRTSDSTRDVRVAIYGDVNLNIIDGSAVWLQSIVSVLARNPRNAVTVVLKATEERDLLSRGLRDMEGVTVINPVDEGKFSGTQLSCNQALDVLEELDKIDRFDIFVMRGFALCHAAAVRRRQSFTGRLWPYLTDIPQHREELEPDAVARLNQVVSASRYLLCQTESLRCFLESYIPASAGRAILLRPMIPDFSAASRAGQAGTKAPLRLVYMGKFAPLWNTLEMTRTVAAMRSRGIPVELHMIGDKIHRDKSSPTFYDEMKAALENTDGVIWHGGMAREQTQTLLQTFDVALGWRNERLDDSLELSTKLLEYGAAGIPVIMNRNRMHEELFGANYALFANTRAQFEEVVSLAANVALRREAADACTQVARGFTFSAADCALRTYIDRAVPRRDMRSQGRPRRILVVSHDFKFFTRIQDHLAALRGVELRVDRWTSITEHDEQESVRLLDWADIVICEWCANNAIWYSMRAGSAKKLIVRLHRFELFGRYPTRLNFDNIDHIVFVDEHYRSEAATRFSWQASKLSVIANWVDTRQLDRKKIFGAPFNIGMIGTAPMRKRLDRALTIMELLREQDHRFRLFIKSKHVWQYPWIWSKREEREHYHDIYRRVNASPLLQDAVQFDGFGPDVAAWLRKIGFVLSTSDDESFHLSPAEGMASGALPMFLPWPGVHDIYPSEWIHDDEASVAAKILSVCQESTWERKATEARAYIDDRFSVERVCHEWESLVLGTD